MNRAFPVLPLLLDGTPPGLELILRQEGVPYRYRSEANLRAGKFVLFDGRTTTRERVESTLLHGQAAIDVDDLRYGERTDPFRAFIDLKADRMAFEVSGAKLIERVARRNKAEIRRRVLDKLSAVVRAKGGLWARLSPFPHPFRSAFNLRIDLDEPNPADYALFAKARTPLEDCTTHFVSTAAYAELPAVLADLRRYDTQSHGHHHVVSSDQDFNRRNLRKAHEILAKHGIESTGYAAPHGRWNQGLDEVIAELGYEFSSDFSLGYDDLPFFPWLGDRFSNVLQVPIHPVCEGLFIDAGIGKPATIAQYFLQVIQAKISAHEPAFIYGHPERRLAGMPEVLRAIGKSISLEPLVWRTTLTAYAHWWKWRSARVWSVMDLGHGRYEMLHDDWSNAYPLAIQIVSGTHLATFPIRSPKVAFHRSAMTFEKLPTSTKSLPVPVRIDESKGLKRRIRETLEWETVTPWSELPVRSIRDSVKKGLRLLADARPRREGAGS